MNCADCDKPHNGIDGLMPRKAGRIEHVNVQAWDMLCRDCLTKRDKPREPGCDDDLGG